MTPSPEYYETLWQGVPIGLEPHLARARLRFLLDHLKASERLLDIGCGEGWFAAAARDAGVDVVGVEVAAEPLRRARSLHPELELLLVAPGAPLPLRDAAFDVVWAGEVIEHVHDTAGFLSELRRVLRPSGLLLLSTPAHQVLWRMCCALSPSRFELRFDPRSDHLRFYSSRSLRRLLEDFRFIDISIAAAGGLPGARSVMLASAKRARF